LSQKRQLGTQFIKHTSKTLGGSPISGVDLVGFPEGFDDEVNRTVLKMESAAIWQQSYLRSVLH
jgi:hypothetical protein